MGVWGTGLYSGDVAADLRTVFADMSRLPVDADRLVELVRSSFAQAAEPEDDSYTDFWLAMADLCHGYGLSPAGVRERALEIIAGGSDLERKRAAGMSERDLRRRSKVLDALAQKLAVANPKPKKRKVVREPEEWLFDDGDFVSYPTSQNQPLNPYFTRQMMEAWAPDGAGAFLVLGRTRMLDYFAAYLILILKPISSPDPELATFLSDQNIVCAPAFVNVSAAHARKMRLKTLARLPIVQEAIDAEFSSAHAVFQFRPGELVDALYLKVPTQTYPWSQYVNLRAFIR